MEFCKEGRFHGLNKSAQYIGITKEYLCPMDDFNFTLFGTYSAQTAKLLAIYVDYCT